MSAPGKPPLDPQCLGIATVFPGRRSDSTSASDTKSCRPLELLGTESREPVRGKDASVIWAALFPALAVK